MGLMQRILAVDDNDRNLMILQRLFESDYEVMTARSGEESVMLARTFRPDIILLDVMMPGMDGYETCRQVRAQETGARPKIIMVTARAMQSERIEGYSCGADDYITKPFDHDELRAKVRVYMALKSAQEIDRLRQQLLVLLRHETQTPVSIIHACLEMLVDDGKLDPSQRQMTMMAAEATKRLSTMIDRALLLSRLRAGEFELEPVASSMDRVLAGVVDSRRPRIEDKRLRISGRVEPEMTAPLDQLFEEFVLGALLDCQIERCEADSELQIVAEALGPTRVAIRLSRAACPDDAQFRQSAFDAFNIDDVTHHTRGDGLGLAIAQALTQHHGGTLDVELTDAELIFHLVIGSSGVPLEQQMVA